MKRYRILVSLSFFIFLCALGPGCLGSAWIRAGLSTNAKTKKISQTRIKGARALPPWGSGYTTYSWLGAGIGRQYGDHRVIASLIDGLAKASTKTDTTYVVAEIGHANGALLKPHSSHKMGLKVDILTPMRDVKSKKPKVLPSHIFNLWGYCWSIHPKTYRVQGKKWEVYSKKPKARRQYCPTTQQDLGLEVDFEAMRDMIIGLRDAARTHNTRLVSVILDASFIKKVGPIKGVKLTSKAWIRHDEHLHFSFR